jgi:rhodanese-related sulfurtransferase
MKKALRYLTVVILLFSAPGFAQTEPQDIKEITAPELKNMIDGGKATVIHCLSEIEYKMQHITGSVNIPITRMDEAGLLPESKETPLVFYCMGER